MPEGQGLQYAQTPDGQYHAFPAEATPQQIAEALNAHLTAPKERTLGQKIVGAINLAGSTMQGAPTVQKELDMLPAAGGVVGGALGAGAGTVFGAGVGAVPGTVGGAALGGGTGEAAKQLISRGLGLDAPGTPTEAAKAIGTQAAVQGGAALAGEGVGAAMKAAAPALMQSAVKMSPAMAREFRTTSPKVAQTLLDEGINVTKGGLEKLNQLFGETNDKIAQAVENAPGSISKKNIAAYTLPTAVKMGNQTNPTAALKDVGDTVTEFMNHPIYQGAELSPMEAQALKKGTYQQLGDAYGSLSSASNETQKALARGAKEELAAAVPGISELNARDSQLMAARAGVGQRVAVAGNQNPVGFALVAHANPKAFLAGLIDRSPAVKSMLANGMWKEAEAASGVSANALRALVANVASEGKGSR